MRLLSQNYRLLEFRIGLVNKFKAYIPKTLVLYRTGTIVQIDTKFLTNLPLFIKSYLSNYFWRKE